MNETIGTSQLEKLELVHRHAQSKLITAIIAIPAFACFLSSMPAMSLPRRVPSLAANSDEISICMMVLGLFMMVVGTIFGMQDLRMIRDASRNLDKRILPVLFEMLKRQTAMAESIWFDNRRSVDPLASMGGLTYILALVLLKVEEEDAILVSAVNRVVLRNMLSHQNQGLLRGALHALGAIGDHEDLAAVRQFIDDGTAGRTNVSKEAEDAVEAMRVRIYRDNSTDELANAIANTVQHAPAVSDGVRSDGRAVTPVRSQIDTMRLRNKLTLFRRLDYAGTITTICLIIACVIIMIYSTMHRTDNGLVVFDCTALAGYAAAMYTGYIRSARRKMVMQDGVTNENLGIGVLLDVYLEYTRQTRLATNNKAAWNRRREENIQAASVKLVHTLPKVQESDGIRLSAHQHAVLRGLLNNTNQYLVSGAIHALEVLGNADDLVAIDAFIQKALATEPWQVEGAERAATAIRTRISSRDAVSTLVRASGMPDAQPDELVRAVVQDGPERHPEELLRAKDVG